MVGIDQSIHSYTDDPGGNGFQYCHFWPGQAENIHFLARRCRKWIPLLLFLAWLGQKWILVLSFLPGRAENGLNSFLHTFNHFLQPRLGFMVLLLKSSLRQVK